VVDGGQAPAPPLQTVSTKGELTATETACYQRLEEGYSCVKDGLMTQAGVVQEFGDSRSARLPWLDRLALPSHLEGLVDEEIKSSYTLSSRGKEMGPDDVDASLVAVLAAAEAVFRDAYELCSDSSPDRR
jgi:hypothetical protein